jgi:hypothetical protein
VLLARGTAHLEQIHEICGIMYGNGQLDRRGPVVGNVQSLDAQAVAHQERTRDVQGSVGHHRAGFVVDQWQVGVTQVDGQDDVVIEHARGKKQRAPPGDAQLQP